MPCCVIVELQHKTQRGISLTNHFRCFWKFLNFFLSRCKTLTWCCDTYIIDKHFTVLWTLYVYKLSIGNSTAESGFMTTTGHWSTTTAARCQPGSAFITTGAERSQSLQTTHRSTYLWFSTPYMWLSLGAMESSCVVGRRRGGNRAGGTGSIGGPNMCCWGRKPGAPTMLDGPKVLF